MSKFVIGIDIGGTNTDSVLLQDRKIISSSKTLTTKDVITGVINSLNQLQIKSKISNLSRYVQYISLGTTHFINSLLESKNLSPVNVIRLSGPCGNVLEPFALFPEFLKQKIQGEICYADGGLNYDGISAISSLNIERDIKPFVEHALKKQLNHFVICETFSFLNSHNENQVEDFLKENYRNLSITKSHCVGKLGFIERENCAILNETLKPIAKNLLENLVEKLKSNQYECPIMMTLNDGTIQMIHECINYPIKTFACGMTNSMRGAAFLSELTNAIVVDVGGTSTDCGLLINGFPKLSSIRLDIAGCPTNLSCPEVTSIALGGGSIIDIKSDNSEVIIGPESVGQDLINQSLCCGGKILTPTCIAVVKNHLKDFGKRENLDNNNLKKEVIDLITKTIENKLEDLINKVRINDKDIPVLLIGGGHIIIDENFRKLKTGSVIKRIKYGELANAIGAAIAQMRLEIDTIVNYDKIDKESFLQTTWESVCQQMKTKGVDEQSLQLVYHEEFPLPYIPGNLARVIMKYVGDIQLNELQLVNFSGFHVDYTYNAKCSDKITKSENKLENFQYKSMNNLKEIESEDIVVVDKKTLELITLGSGLLGCGGGGNSWLSKQMLLNQYSKTDNRPKIIQSWPDDDSTGFVLPVAMAGSPSVIIEKLLSNQQLQAVMNVSRVENIYGFMSAEIGGLNSIIPLFLSIITGLPVVNCDGMGRAFPELQMYIPTILGNSYLPVTIIDEFGNLTELDYKNNSHLSDKEIENKMRTICIEKGCSVLLILPPIPLNDLKKFTVLNTYTKCIFIGKEIYDSKHSNRYKNIIDKFSGANYGTWKITNIQRNITGGFIKGYISLKSLSNNDEAKIKFQNEYLILIINKQIKVTVPDLICTLLNDTGHPVMTEELKYGLIIDIITLRADPIWHTEKCMKYVSPSCFGYSNNK